VKTNYIQKLQEQTQAQEAVINVAKKEIGSMIAFLHGPKFVGHEGDGSRKDWISTGDLITWLQNLRSDLNA
jgi:hypothetical protein